MHLERLQSSDAELCHRRVPEAVLVLLLRGDGHGEVAVLVDVVIVSVFGCVCMIGVN